MSQNQWILDAEWSTDGKNIWIVVVRHVSTQAVLRFFHLKDFNGWFKYQVPAGLTLIGHSIIDSDKRQLERVWGIDFTGVTFYDTLLLSRLDDPMRPGGHDLDNWGKIVGVPKGDFNDWDNPGPHMYDYCEQDTLVTWHAWQRLKPEPGNVSVNIEHRLQLIGLTPTKEKGFKMDVEFTKDLLCELEYELAAITSDLQGIFPEKVEYKQLKTKIKVVKTPFNPGSRTQVAERLIEKGWKPTVLTPTGKPQVDETTLAGVDIPEAQVMQRYFMLQKRIGMLKNWLGAVEADGRVRCYIIGNGTITGRASHSSPNLGQVVGVQSEYGAEFRKCWTVDNGNVLVGVDLKSLEGRIMCHYSKDEEYAKAVCYGTKEDGTDIHTVNMKAFGLTDRDVAKTCYYALLYGAGAGKIAKIVGCSVGEAEKIINNFYRALPKLAALKERVGKLARKQGWLPGLDWRKVYVRSEHSALNTLFQSGGAIVSKRWYIKTVEGLTKAGLRATVVMWVHDELQIECAHGVAAWVKRICEQAAVEAGKELGIRVPIEASSKVGKTWYDTH